MAQNFVVQELGLHMCLMFWVLFYSIAKSELLKINLPISDNCVVLGA